MRAVRNTRASTAVWAVLWLAVGLAQSGARTTIWDGVYTEAQARRGQGAYEGSCAPCHQADLSGGGVFEEDQAPPLRGLDRYVARKDLDNLFVYVRERMPADDRASLADATYVDILAYLLHENAVPAGREELRADRGALRAILITPPFTGQRPPPQPASGLR